jgi:hypothetical protein
VWITAEPSALFTSLTCVRFLSYASYTSSDLLLLWLAACLATASSDIWDYSSYLETNNYCVKPRTARRVSFAQARGSSSVGTYIHIDSIHKKNSIYVFHHYSTSAYMHVSRSNAEQRGAAPGRPLNIYKEH